MANPEQSVNNQPNPRTFTAPASLEACLARLPAETKVNYTDPDTCFFDATPIIWERRNDQFMRVRVTLERTPDNQTVVQGDVKLSLNGYLVLGIAYIGTILSLFLVPIQYTLFGLVVSAFIIYVAFLDKDPFADSVLSLFKRVRKVPKPLSPPWAFPFLPFKADSQLSPAECVLALKQLSFMLMVVQVVALDAKNYQFSVKPLGLRWSFARVWGNLRYEEGHSTHITYRVGITVQLYLFILVYVAAGVLIINFPIFAFSPGNVLLCFGAVTCLNGAFAAYSIKKTLTEKLQLT